MKLGHCYMNCAKWLLENPDAGFRLVHSTCTGRNAIEGQSFGHAFLSNGAIAIDITTDKAITMPLELYVVIGEVRETREYTARDVLKHIGDTGHWGPWE